jgi:hypothetical protein
MGKKESELEAWGFGMSASVIFLGIVLLVFAIMVLTGQTPATTLNIMGGICVVLGVAAVATAGYSIYKMETLHKAYRRIAAAAARLAKKPRSTVMAQQPKSAAAPKSTATASQQPQQQQQQPTAGKQQPPQPTENTAYDDFF